ncbi:retinaldehyde-binding protein 1 [Caerostris darwini]|uniref:Retinaldehyde-binding protein 1 n=1 Tax=Caerostris darwini TaxID=1538125 RepID=A0AAV4R6Y2_9ARAC|nr:retinaldehyde-binding protein 1 [Caerostris darwini]
MFIRDPQSARIGEEILPFELENVPEFFQKKAEVELHDTPEKRAQGLRQIKEFAKNDKHTKNVEYDDDFLLQYLRARKYNVAKAFSQLKGLSILKKKNPGIFTDLSYDKTVNTINKKIMTILPWRCQDGCTIVLVELDNWNPSEFPVEEIKRAVAVYLLQSLREPMTQINGFKIIIDVKSNPLKHLKYCTPNNIYLMYHGTQECIAGRYKEIHIVNQSMTFKAAWIIIKPFLTDKLKKRIIFHNNSSSLLNYFPKDVLPKQYGGNLLNYNMADWLKRAMAPAKLALLGGQTNKAKASVSS